MSGNIRLIYTYSIAALVILGGLLIIYFTRLDPPEADVQGLRLLLAGFVGSALTFVFGRESASSSAYQSERAYAAGLAAPTIPESLGGLVTVTPGPVPSASNGGTLTEPPI